MLSRELYAEFHELPSVAMSEPLEKRDRMQRII
jgi:hypothetical protein